MSLRLQVNLIITTLLGVFASLLIGLQIDNTRRSVREEVLGANVVAIQLLSRVNYVYGYSGLEGMTEFLSRVGRIRANEIELYDDQGKLVACLSISAPADRLEEAWIDRLKQVAAQISALLGHRE